MKVIPQKLSEIPQHLMGRVLPASALSIRADSYGIVSSSRLIDFSRQCFDPRGLFSETIFGPIRPLRCQCGKFSGEDHRRTVCDECGVMAESTDLRRRRFGSIELRLPVVHPFWYGDAAGPVELLTGLTTRQLRGLLSRKLGLDCSRPADLALIPNGLDQWTDESESKSRLTGAAAIRHLLLQATADGQPVVVAGQQQLSRRGVERRQRLLGRFASHQVEPRDLVLETLPVLPAALRCIGLDAEQRLLVDPATRGYQRIVAIDRAIRRNLGELDNRPHDYQPTHRRLAGLERRLRRAVRRLFAELLSPRRLEDRLLRRLGPVFKSRVNTWPGIPAAAAVAVHVVADPRLKLDECRLPREVARELSRREIIQTLVRLNIPWETAITWADERHPNAERVLDHIYETTPTLVGFQPDAVTSRWLQLRSLRSRDGVVHVHPLLAGWFGLPLDGRPITAWRPSSYNSRADYRRLHPSEGLRDAATGEICWQLSAAALLGCHLATWEPEDQRLAREGLVSLPTAANGRPCYYATSDEVQLACESRLCELRSPIVFYVPRSKLTIDGYSDDPQSNPAAPALRTTAGRALLNAILPEYHPFINRTFGPAQVKSLVEEVLQKQGAPEVLRLVERLEQFGGACLHRSGLSLALSDLPPPSTKAKLVDRVSQQVEKLEKLFVRGIIGMTERDNQILDAWTLASYDISRDLLNELRNRPQSPLSAMAHAGELVSPTALDKLCGMVGLLAPDGCSRLQPIQHSLAEGLSAQEYFLFARGTRRDNIDQALRNRAVRTLARRLANVARNVVITAADCGTRYGVQQRAPGIEDRHQPPLAAKIRGRVSCETVVDPRTETEVITAGQLITPTVARELELLGVDRLEVRSPLTCEVEHGICQHCYGADPRTGELAPPGTAVGILAATSIASLLSQLRTRTYRTGWISRRSAEGVARAKRHGVVMLNNVQLATNAQGCRVALAAGVVEIADGRQRVVEAIEVPRGARIVKAVGDSVRAGEIVAEWTPGIIDIYARSPGAVAIDDLLPGRNMQLVQTPGGPPVWKIHQALPGKHPCIRIEDVANATVDFCFLPPESRLLVVPGALVDRGVLLAQLPATLAETRDFFIGGISSVDHLLSARQPPRKAVLAEVSGIVRRQIDHGARRCIFDIFLLTAAGDPGQEFFRQEVDLRHTGYVLAGDGDHVSAGERLTQGEISPRDLLRILGTSGAGEFLLQELRMCFLGQRKPIALDERHLEVIIARQLAFVRVESPHDSGLKAGDLLPRAKIQRLNRRMREWLKIEQRGDSYMPEGRFVSPYQFELECRRVEKAGGVLPVCSTPWPASFRPVLMGIDHAADFGSSFLTPRGFTTTRRALRSAALNGDWHDLETVKDSIITDELMPAGSGWRTPTMVDR